ncbi:MAG: P27 family phage terminase small subunit [Oscillospiraceae bacterium]
MAGRQKKATAAEVRESLERQLRDRGADLDVYKCLLDDYMFYFAQERKMQADIKHRGLMVTSVSAQGKEYERENPSIKAAALYNKQKLQILKELNLTTGNCRPADDGGGDL